MCLRKDLRQRAQAIGDVRLALDGAFESDGPQAAITPAGRWWRWRIAFALAAGAAMAAAAMLPLVLRSEALPRIARFQIHAPAGSSLPLGTPAISDDGRMLAYTVADADGITRIHLRAIDQVDTRVLPGTEGAVHPFWSPDGRAIAFATPSDGQLKRIEIDAGVPRALGGVTGPWHGTWAARSILLVSGSVASRIPDEGGSREPVAQLRANSGERTISFPSFLADGQRFLVRVADAKKSSIQLGIARIDGPDARARQRHQRPSRRRDAAWPDLPPLYTSTRPDGPGVRRAVRHDPRRLRKCCCTISGRSPTLLSVLRSVSLRPDHCLPDGRRWH